MNDEIVDLLKIKIEKAKRDLPLEAVNAIDSVDWRASILVMRSKYGYTFEQLGDLELETELLLCGLVSPEDYPKELENRMGIGRAQANQLVNEMNELVFSKIRAELVKNTERKRIFADRQTVTKDVDLLNPINNAKEEKINTDILGKAGIEIVSARNSKENMSIGSDGKVPVSENALGEEKLIPNNTTKQIPDVPTISITPIAEKPKEEIIPASILTEKLFAPVKMEIANTDHSLPNLSTPIPPTPASIKPKIPNVDPYREVPE